MQQRIPILKKYIYNNFLCNKKTPCPNKKCIICEFFLYFENMGQIIFLPHEASRKAIKITKYK